MNDLEERIAELEAKLEIATEELAELERSRQAMLNLQEDMEEMTEALSNSRERLEEEVEVTTHLLMISEATVHTTDIDRLMQQVVHCAHEIMRCGICLSYLYDEESKIFQPCQEFGLSHRLVPVFRTEPIDEKMEFVRKALEGREPVVEKISGQWPVVSGQQNPTTDHFFPMASRHQHPCHYPPYRKDRPSRFDCGGICRDGFETRLYGIHRPGHEDHARDHAAGLRFP